MAAVATYPGTVTPLRGLAPFSESERDVFFGRDKEREDLARLVTSEGFRAGLLYGEPGAGKTSLLRAGLVPHLRDHGIIALVCDDPGSPADSFANALAASGLAPADGESSMVFLARVVGQAMAGQMYLFIIDDVDSVLAHADDRVISEIGDLFSRVVTRSGGRARFLFSCASERVHLFGQLERRTGSLFPPSSRFELARFRPEDAAMVLDRTLALAGVAADPALASAVAYSLTKHGSVLAADLQITALALRAVGVSNLAGFEQHGSAVAIEREWIKNAAASTGNERSALRLLAELASDDAAPAYAVSWAAARTSIDPAFAAHAFAAFEQQGLVRQIHQHGVTESHYVIAHEALKPTVLEVAYPARAAAKRTFELLGSKAQEGKRLGLRDWLSVRGEGVVPATPAERDVVERSKRFYSAVAIAAIATPLVLLIIIYISMSGHAYLSTRGHGNVGDGGTVVLRAGRSGLSAFHWMPASPGFGDIVADTGLNRALLGDKAWQRAAQEGIGVDNDAASISRAINALLPPTDAALIEYAATGSDDALAALRKTAAGPDELANVLVRLAPIARGTEAEVEFIEAAMKDQSATVQTAALQVAAHASRHRAAAYAGTLAQALVSDEDELRRLAFSMVRELGDEAARPLFEAALGKDPDAAARRELLAEVSASGTGDSPSAASAAAVLGGADISPATREQARSLMRRAFAADPMSAASSAAKLAANSDANPIDREFALGLLLELAPEESFGELTDAVKDAVGGRIESVKAAALPIYARVAPKDAAGILAALLEDTKASKPLRVAMALAWGEVARTKEPAAQVALEKLLKDGSSEVRAAAAEAYGFVGRGAQAELTKIVKTERLDVAVGACFGLANSAEVGASASVAVGGIVQLWKRKGKSRREAARVFARMARKKASAVSSYLVSAARNTEDDGLHPLGVEGLCNAAGSGHVDSRRQLARVADDPSVEVRRLVIQCIADHPDLTKQSASVAARMVNDTDSTIRAEAARVLSAVAAQGKVSGQVAEALVALVNDADRDVRVTAVRALSGMDGDPPASTSNAFSRAFERGDEAEKLSLLRAGRKLGLSELVPIANSDPSPTVRIAALDSALATGSNVSSTISAALTDADLSVRRAAIERMGDKKDAIDAEVMNRGLALAIRDANDELARAALTTFARVGDRDEVIARLRAGLTSRSETVRSTAAAATIGLVERDAKAAIELLTPRLGDDSHDVRVALLEPLGTAYAQSMSPDQLAAMLRDSERHAARRLAVAAAFLVLARTEAGLAAAEKSLTGVASDGPAMARRLARLTLGLVTSAANGLEFLASQAH